jgi:hypothetical protein
VMAGKQVNRGSLASLATGLACVVGDFCWFPLPPFAMVFPRGWLQLGPGPAPVPERREA